MKSTCSRDEDGCGRLTRYLIAASHTRRSTKKTLHFRPVLAARCFLDGHVQLLYSFALWAGRRYNHASFEFWEKHAIAVRIHRPSRLPFVAAVQVTCVDTGGQIAARTEDLTLSGCFVETAAPFADGTKLALRFSYRGTIVAAHGEVAYSRTGTGMGIRFTSVEPESVPVLDAWLTDFSA
jgi:PilZ domain